MAYKVPGVLKNGEIEDLILAMVRGPYVPDAITILCLADEQEAVFDALSADVAELARARLTGRVPLLLATYDLLKGRSRVRLLDRSFSATRRELTTPMANSLADCLQSGLAHLFTSEAVLLQAPSGYAYHKPRGSRSEYFLKPDMAMDSSASVALVALAIYERLFGSDRNAVRQLDQIYVDTMAIAPVAFALRELLMRAGAVKLISIESFHSYDGIKEVPLPLPGTSLCLISASSSMALHEDWLREKQVGRREALTLLTFDDVKAARDGALAVLPRPVSSDSSSTAPLSIQIKGESFLPVPEPTRKVLLAEEIHKCPEETGIIQKMSDTGVLDLWRRTSVPSSRPRALYVDGDALLQHKPFLDWIEAQLKQNLKAATRVVIHQDDKSSQHLAKIVKDSAEQRYGIQGLQLLSSTELATAKVGKDDGAVICSAVAGKGSQLLQVSRDLREKQSGPRLYIVGIQVAELRAELSGLIANLKFSKTASFEVLRFAGFAVGAELGRSFQAEAEMYSSVSSAFKGFPKSVGDRAQRLGGVHAVGASSLLPAARDLSGRLALRPGFAYWYEPYVAGPLQPEVVTTVAAILQRAREDQRLPRERRLSSNTFGHVALDPANFTRFNDGVIQAALLRAASDAELDFRADYAASDFMKALLLRMIQRAQEQTGEGILEFALALGIGRLQLCGDHLTEVLAAVIGAAPSLGPLGKVMLFLLQSYVGGRPSRNRNPF